MHWFLTFAHYQNNGKIIQIVLRYTFVVFELFICTHSCASSFSNILWLVLCVTESPDFDLSVDSSSKSITVAMKRKSINVTTKNESFTVTMNTEEVYVRHCYKNEWKCKGETERHPLKVSITGKFTYYLVFGSVCALVCHSVCEHDGSKSF